MPTHCCIPLPSLADEQTTLLRQQRVVSAARCCLSTVYWYTVYWCAPVYDGRPCTPRAALIQTAEKSTLHIFLVHPRQSAQSWYQAAHKKAGVENLHCIKLRYLCLCSQL